jgi:hypothetical protein
MSQLSLSTGQISGQANVASTRLHGRWLLAARVTWVALVGLALALCILGLPAYYQRIQVPCIGTVACQLDGALTPAGVRALQTIGVSLSAYAAYNIALLLVLVVVWSTVGFVIFWRRSDEWIALLVALTLALFSTVQQDTTPTALAMAHPAWTIPVEAMNFLSEFCLGLFFYLFPNGRFAPRWTRWCALFFALITALEIFPPVDSPLNALLWPDWVRGLSFLFIFLSVIFSQVYRYRRMTTPTQRQQVKWAVSGVVVSLVGVLVLNLLNGFATAVQPGSFLEIAANTLLPLIFLPIPLSLAIAILRYRLWEIDAIINKALVYGLLSVLLAAVYAGLVLGLQALLGGLLHQTSAIALVVSTLAIYALFRPLRHRIQAAIDRRFYRRRYDAAKILTAFSATLRNEVDLATLSEHLVAVVEETMQPTSVSLWLRPPPSPGTQHASWSTTLAGSSEQEARKEGR